MILGVDEVGRGAWAGPLVVGACVLNGAKIEGLTDSKKITKKQREKFNDEIKKSDAVVGLGWVSAAEINQIGLSEALVRATELAVKKVTDEVQSRSLIVDEIIIDGTVDFLRKTELSKKVTLMKKADLLIPCVSAAAIVAKVARDNFMTKLDDTESPQYRFGAHAGYGTKKHQQALDEFGACDQHRKNFKPIKKTKELGDFAEEKVADLLVKKGHKILERNWKNRWCEIDIVSSVNETIYFTEVKYRKNNNFGGAISAITPAKLKQMKFSAEFFAHKNKPSQMNNLLCVALVEGEDFTILDWIELT